uniref:Ribosomal protein L16 n=1 Tax=Cyclospora cayetanensis TaxID=88456 RepID=A0A0K0NU67_9EIME|nr:ribosomal protein L16 [Cyclospora cayetanensis]AKO71980.1 ribosomal protein L16 [Cyclospora cayetanensis]
MKKFIFTKNIKYKGINFHKCIYGIWAIQNIKYGNLSNKHINFIKQYLQKNIKKIKCYKLNITINRIQTKKPLDTRMGGGKGSIYDTQYFLKPGFIFLEFYNIPVNIIFSIFKIFNTKLPIKIRLININ